MSATNQEKRIRVLEVTVAETRGQNLGDRMTNVERCVRDLKTELRVNTVKVAAIVFVVQIVLTAGTLAIATKLFG